MKSRVGMIILWILVLVSLALNGYLLFALNQARLQAQEALTNTRASVQNLGTTPFTTTVHVDQLIPFSTTLPLSQTFTVPIDTTYPLNTVVHTAIQIPLLGPQDIAVPIAANIPLQLNLQIPVRMQIPISLTYQLKTDLPVQVKLPPETLDFLDQLLEQAAGALK